VNTQFIDRAGPLEAGAVSGLVLCGGQSRRMGADKARVELAGRDLIGYPLAALAELGVKVRLACGATERYADLGFERVLDGLSDGGPLAGLAAGLDAAARAGEEWLLVLACDMPRASASVLRELLQRARERGLDACLAELERGSQPTYAVYHVRCAGPARAALNAGERRLVSFHGGLRVGTLALGGAEDADSALNLNTPSELASERAARSVGGGAR
jgi:molybdopterin-guanine dinucleotide biosynthesis protein A